MSDNVIIFFTDDEDAMGEANVTDDLRTTDDVNIIDDVDITVDERGTAKCDEHCELLDFVGRKKENTRIAT
eukprot:5912306-Prorocentrum_lima.AAC.1